MLALASSAQAQFHGIQIGKSCQGPKCVGEFTDCSVAIGHADGFGDTIELIEAWDVIDPLGINVRVPAVGNLPVVSIQGNAYCTDSGGICDQSLGVNCALPCRIGAANSVLSGLPGDPQPGFIVFRQNQYLIQPGDPSPLLNQANIRYRDLCDNPATLGCSMLPVTAQFTAATTITPCPDELCATGMCSNGICTYEPDCVVNSDCTDDGNVCTTETCVPVPGGPGACCESIPECEFDDDCLDDGNPCTAEFCTPLGCCDFVPDCTVAADCDDQNVCSTDACNNFCCVNTRECLTASDCTDDGNPCTTEICTPDGCCDVIPDCTVAADCDDQNVCSTDTCNNFCCVNTRECLTGGDCTDDGNICTIEICTPDGCCDALADCTVDADCDDQNACTTDSCLNQCCVYGSVVCNDNNA